jgi:catabolite regulation protein CreA
MPIEEQASYEKPLNAQKADPSFRTELGHDPEVLQVTCYKSFMQSNHYKYRMRRVKEEKSDEKVLNVNPK